MKFIISGKNITVSQGLKTAVEDKLGKLERSNDPDERKYHQIRTGKQ